MGERHNISRMMKNYSITLFFFIFTISMICRCDGEANRLNYQKPLLSDLTHLNYRYSSYAVPNPLEAVTFIEKYITGFILQQDELLIKPLASNTDVSEIYGIRIPYNKGETFADIYFVREDGLPENPRLTLEDFIERLEMAHTFSQDDWDWWQDWHLAFHVDDLDAVATRLSKDGIPFVTRSISFYFKIPGTPVIIQVLGEHNYFWTTPFAFCRQTGDDTTRYLPRYDQNVTDIGSLPYPSVLPEFVPSHQSWTSSDALADLLWTAKFLPTFVPIDMTDVFGDTHQHANGTCAQIAWMSDTGYNTMDGKGWALHYIEQFVKRDGGLSVPWVENIMKETRGEFGTRFEVPDVYFEFRTAFSCSNLESYLLHFERENEPYLLIDERMYVQNPSGKIFEIYEGL